MLRFLRRPTRPRLPHMEYTRLFHRLELDSTSRLKKPVVDNRHLRRQYVVLTVQLRRDCSVLLNSIKITV